MRYNEIIKESADTEPYVVIINKGRGQQATWPSSDKPGLYTQAEAQAIVDAEKARQTPLNGGYQGNAHWHAQPLKNFKNYVAAGNVCYNRLDDLLMDMPGQDEDY